MAAKAVSYVGAGTVEFIMDAKTNEYFFMEMNTRLQVEHPVTEMITGLDLVHWQLQVASGFKLPLSQDQVKMTGHSMETRIYAENPHKYTIIHNINSNFMPDTGKLVHIRTPNEVENVVRVETGVRQNDEVSVFYDPMIAKLVVKAKDRIGAIRLLSNCLEQYEIVGVRNNVDFLKKVLGQPAFIDGKVETGFIAKHLDKLLEKSMDNRLITLAGLFCMFHKQASSIDPFSSINGDRVNLPSERKVSLELSDGTLAEIVYNCDSSLAFVKNNGKLLASFNVASHTLQVTKDKIVVFLKESTEAAEQREECTLVKNGSDLHLFNPRLGHFTFRIPDSRGNNQDGSVGHASQSAITSPMPSKISSISVKEGDVVKKGQILMILEAMKMEHVIKCPSDNVKIGKIFYSVGDVVPEKKTLIKFA